MPEIIEALRQALLRGVEVVAVVPAEGTISEELAELSDFDHFTLAGLAGLGNDGKRNPVWIHAKLMLVDGDWGTVGSCNLHRYSLFGNSELNVAFWDQPTARGLLDELLHEHLDLHTTGLDDLAALQLFSQDSQKQPTALFENNDNRWEGLAFNLLPLSKFRIFNICLFHVGGDGAQRSGTPGVPRERFSFTSDYVTLCPWAAGLRPGAERV